MNTQIPEPIVSVVMPAYNCENYISTAIESVLVQDISLELIIINDCSRDNTEKVIESYASNYPQIRYYKNETNLGASGSRNRAIQLAKGKYIAFLDSDDWWEAGKLTKQLQLMEASNSVLCSTART